VMANLGFGSALLMISVVLSVCPAGAIQDAASAGDQSKEYSSRGSEGELQSAIALTRRGQFATAIPHFLAVRGAVKEQYAANFNLALCYIGIAHYKEAIPVLTELQNTGHDNADVDNLLAQAYVGDSQPAAALTALHKAVELTPTNEKLYIFVADACTDHQSYALGLKVVDIGLEHLPLSARLHYERAMFLSALDQFDLAKVDFDLVQRLASNSAIADLASAQKFLYAGEIDGAVRASREGLKKDNNDVRLLTVFGDALIRSGISADQPEFSEARSSLEKAVAERPRFAGSHIALGKLYLLENHLTDAIAQLELARQLDAGDPSVYANLAKAYERSGKPDEAKAALATLAKLNQAQAEKISSAPGDRKVSYGQVAH